MKTTSKQTTGTRAQVMHGTALKTTGGLLKKDLVYNKSGDIVTKKKSMTAKKSESGLLKLWRKAVKQVSATKQYEDKFVKIKKGSVAYKKVFSEYEKLVREKYSKTHSISKKKIDGSTKLVLTKKIS